VIGYLFIYIISTVHFSPRKLFLKIFKALKCVKLNSNGFYIFITIGWNFEIAGYF